MSVVVKSERMYQGQQTLQAASAIVFNYAAYVARVQADGGEIVDAAHTEDTFDFLIAQGVDLAQFVVGPRFGVRQSRGIIEKLYSFDGNDMVPASSGAGPFIDYSGAYDVCRVDGVSAFKYFVSSRALPLLAPGATGFCMGMAGAAYPNPKFGYFNAMLDGTTNFPLFSLQMLNTASNALAVVGQDNSYNPALGPTIFSLETVNVAGYADYAGLVGHVNMSTNTVTAYKDGVSSGTVVVAPAIYAYGGAAPKLSFGLDNGGGIYKTNTFAELWQIRNCSAAVAAALSTRLGTLY
jgi:hypothetical protein